MKCTVIKEYAGIKEGATVDIHPNHLSYMLKKGYVTEIETKVIDTYDTKVIEVPKNKGGRPKTKK